jgi:hypothetical protein
MTERVWLVRRVIGSRGTPLARPSLWGVVRASSETVAVRKFIWLAKMGADPQHFDAIPSKEKP